MQGFSLTLFPFDSSALTVTTTVWLGVLVCVAFNLRFGWTLSGLVVPGYLTPLLMTRPLSVVVILIEAALVYAIAKVVSTWPSRLPYWSSFFGRDRFFFILMISICVRVVMDGYLLPLLGHSVVTTFGSEFDVRDSLHSFGLIVVALIANYFWKPGLRKGLLPMAVSVGVTYGLVVLVVVPYTNFAVGNLYLLYEDITSSLLASPKAYILIITTAYLASWINLRYAWDFNGILIPALLGILWNEPLKILISGIECLVVLSLAQMVLRSSLLRGMTIEGGRKIAFFFTVCYVYRWLLCLSMPVLFPTAQVTDAFGYGFLLSTLVAIKIHDKKRAFAVLMGTAQVSMLGAVSGSAIGFVMLSLPSFGLQAALQPESIGKQEAAVEATSESIDLLTQVRDDKRLLYELRDSESYRVPTSSQIAAFESNLHRLRNWCSSQQRIRSIGNRRSTRIPIEDGAPLTADRRSVTDAVDINETSDPQSLQAFSDIASRFAESNYQLLLVDDRYVYLRERSPANGWGIYVIDLQSQADLGVQVPAPSDEWGTIATGVSVFQMTQARSLSIAGSKRSINRDGSADVLRRRDTLLNVFQNVFCSAEMIQIRGITRTSFLSIASAEGIAIPTGWNAASAKSRMYLQGEMPREFSLAKLREVSDPFEIRWNQSPTANALRDACNGKVYEWFLAKGDRRKIIARSAPSTETRREPGDASPLDIREGEIRVRLAEIKQELLRKDDESFRVATVYEMLFLDNEVITPLFELASSRDSVGLANPLESSIDSRHADAVPEDVRESLRMINQAARRMGYQVDLFWDATDREPLLILRESDDVSAKKGWGTYVFRFGRHESVMIEVPRPSLEANTWECGIEWFRYPRGGVLSLSGADPRANRDGSADVLRTSNRTNLFNLVRHVILREIGNRPFLVMQVRAYSGSETTDVVLATDESADRLDQLSTLKRLFLNPLVETDLAIGFACGQEDLSGLEVGAILRSAVVQLSPNKEAMCLWLSRDVRKRFADQDWNSPIITQFDACDIPIEFADLAERLSVHMELLPGELSPASAESPALPEQLKARVVDYASSHDVIQLYELLRDYPRRYFRVVVDTVSRQTFLWVQVNENQPPVIANLSGALSGRCVNAGRTSQYRIRHCIQSRVMWLTFTEPES